MANALLPGLLAFPPEKQVSVKEWDKQANEYVKQLAKLPDSTWTKGATKENILDLLNPAVNSLPYLFALTAQWNASGNNKTLNEDAFNRSVVFFSSFDAIQMRYAGEQWLKLMELAFEVYPRLGVRDFTPLSTAMLRLDPTAGTFTSHHLRLLRLCVECGVPSQALPILDKNIHAFPQTPAKNLPDEPLCGESDLSNTFITAKSGFSLNLRPEYILEYYLLGAHVYLGLRNYNRSRLFLEYIILTPTAGSSCSALQTEAYKKWILIGLLAQGKQYPIPRANNQAVLKSMKAVGKPYEALAESFEKRQWRKFQAEMDAGFTIWREDGNSRLVKEVSDALLRYRIIDLQKTYAALPVHKVAAHLSLTPDATLQTLAGMIQQNYLNASITPSSTSPNSPVDAVLHFHFASPASNTSENDLEAQTNRIQDLVTFIRDADRRLQLSKEYVDFQKRAKRGAGPDSDLADQMDLSWDPPIGGMEGEDDLEGDEDIMAS